MRTKKPYDKVVYFLQGGGALGTYQAGVCQALLESNFPPNWVIGTSIGSINAAIIAGNKPEYRIKKLTEFWDIIAPSVPTLPLDLLVPFLADNILFKKYKNFINAQAAVLFGQPGFFRPRWFNPWFTMASTPDKISFYDTSALRTTLEKVIDFDIVNQRKIRLSLGAVNANTGCAVHFDSAHQTIGPEHVMASGALPPGFPAIKIDDNYYWDGGGLSNTPFGIIFEEKIPKKLLCFAIQLYSFPEHIPTSIMDVVCARKHFDYASRYAELLNHFSKVHVLQHAINGLAKTIVDNTDLNPALKLIEKSGHPTALNIVRFHYKNAPEDLWSSDFNFSPQVLKKHWRCGYNDVQNANKSAWLNEIGKSDSV